MVSQIRAIVVGTVLVAASAFAPSHGVRPSSSSPLSAAGDISVSLEKPLGLVLEENDAGADAGLYISEILPDGSAASCEDLLSNLQLTAVAGVDCRALGFDAIMDLIGGAASPVDLTFASTTCLLKVVGPKGDSQFISAEKGANLRQTLQANKQALYSFQGTMMNCNGGGQCGLCRVLVEDGDFGERSDWEEGKLKSKPGRLACQTSIDGPSATIVLQPK